jgi:hypothetical protein
MNKHSRLDLINQTEWRNQGEQYYALARILHDIASALEDLKSAISQGARVPAENESR